MSGRQWAGRSNFFLRACTGCRRKRQPVQCGVCSPLFPAASATDYSMANEHRADMCPAATHLWEVVEALEPRRLHRLARAHMHPCAVLLPELDPVPVAVDRRNRGPHRALKLRSIRTTSWQQVSGVRLPLPLECHAHAHAPTGGLLSVVCERDPGKRHVGAWSRHLMARWAASCTLRSWAMAACSLPLLRCTLAHSGHPTSRTPAPSPQLQPPPWHGCATAVPAFPPAAPPHAAGQLQLLRHISSWWPAFAHLATQPTWPPPAWNDMFHPPLRPPRLTHQPTTHLTPRCKPVSQVHLGRHHALPQPRTPNPQPPLCHGGAPAVHACCPAAPQRAVGRFHFLRLKLPLPLVSSSTRQNPGEPVLPWMTRDQ